MADDVTGRPHVQVCVKMNAPVDRGIAELVEALNEFPALCAQSIIAAKGLRS